MVDEHLVDVVNGIKEDLETGGLKKLLEPYGEPYDMRALIDTQGNILEVWLLVAFGGPNVWIISDGKRVRIEGYWWNDYYETLDDKEIAEEILEYGKEVFKYVEIKGD